MANHLLTSNFIFSVEAIVFGLLTYFLWMYYRGFGRQYVKLWTLGCLALSVNYLSVAIQAPNVAPDPGFPQLLFGASAQISNYLYLFFLCSGIYCAKEKHYFSANSLWLMLAVATMLGIAATLFYAFDEGSVFNRFYLRISMQNFVFGCVLLATALFLFTREQHHFSSRIVTATTAIVGLRYLLFSFISVALTADDWVQNLAHLLPFFDICANTVIGFSMLMWIYGAERNAASNAISKAHYLGRHDSLTGLLNREQVLEKLTEQMQPVQERGNQLAIFLIDIKRFKFINDIYGLKTGDYILGQIAHRLTDSILMPCVIGRLSGDSFLFALEIHSQQQIEQAIEHLHEMINRSYFHRDQEINITSSLGYSLFPDDGDQADDLLQKANLALFHAESQQRPTMQFIERMQEQGRQLLQIEKELHRAIEQDEFVLHFQPQLNLLTNRLEGVEALIRWQHPEKGLLPPSEFLPQVESLGLNSKIDNYVLEKSCQTIARWHEEYRRRVTIAINITAVEFQDVKLIATIQALLYQYNIPPKCLDLEITENVVMTDIDSAMKTIVTLQNMGIKVSIDDFGTGYSSLAYLRALPIDKIKIDRSFIAEVAKNDSDLTIVKSMIELSHGLGKRVLAEGVEDAEQLNMLRSIGCDAVQGYFISRPIPEQALAKYLQRK